MFWECHAVVLSVEKIIGGNIGNYSDLHFRFGLVCYSASL